MFKIELPDHFGLPTTTAKLLNALAGIVVTVHANQGEDDTIEIIRAIEDRDGVALQGHPWGADLPGDMVDRSTTLSIPWELIEGITVH